MNRKIKIMHVSYSLDVGGAEMVILELMRGLDRERYEPYVCTFYKNGILHKEFQEIDVPVVVVEKKEGLDYKLPFKLTNTWAKRGLDIIHTHNSSVWLYGGIAKYLSRTPFLVHTEHSNVPENRKKLIFASRGLEKLTDQVIAVSSEVAAFMKEREKISKEKIRVIYNGINLDRFRRANEREKKRNELGIEEEEKVIGIVARLVPVKNHQTLLRAVERLKNRIQARLVIVGDGELRDYLVGLVKELRIDDRVEFLGNRKDVPELMGAMDLFVLSSNSEGCSMTLLEAMASNLPVVATHVGGNPELVRNGETGLLVPHDDPQQMADAICEILSNREKMRDLGTEGRKRVEKEFSIEFMVKKYDEVYQSVCSGQKSK